ncbi:MAG: 50S ribosomal protein L10 [Bauldia sp.]|nr:50S ribosomal protein L10 [Bauldia sp.]
MDRAEKRESVATLNAAFSETGVVIVAHYSGLTVADMTTLRARMRQAGASTKVVKNRLAKLALRGTPAEPISDLFSGPTLVAYSSDPVGTAKAAVDYARTNEKLILLGGAMGATKLDADGIKALATLPSLDELRAKLVGMIQTPATRIAQVIKAPAGQIARVLNAYATKDEAA